MSDLLETTASMLIGMVINWCLVQYIFGVTPFFALGSTGVFFCASWIRVYTLRKVFRHMETKC